MKDWTGNKSTTFKTLGASNHTNHDRAERDYYATPSIAGSSLIDVYPKIKNIWECAYGEGSLSNGFLDKLSKKSDIIRRSVDCEIIDFLKSDYRHSGWIVTNPPYLYALEFAEKALELASDGVALFLRIQFLESQKRQKLFQENPPNFVYVYSKRCPQCAFNGDFSKKTGNATTYCWFIWDKKIDKSESVIRWINL